MSNIVTCILLVSSLAFFTCWGSFSLIIKLYALFLESRLQVGSLKLFLPVSPTCKLFAYFMSQPLQCTLAHLYQFLLKRTWCTHWFTVWSPLCWISSYTVWGTETLKNPCGDWTPGQPNLIFFSILYLWWVGKIYHLDLKLMSSWI
jgi:hypothetical protein